MKPPPKKDIAAIIDKVIPEVIPKVIPKVIPEVIPIKPPSPPKPPSEPITYSGDSTMEKVEAKYRDDKIRDLLMRDIPVQPPPTTDWRPTPEIRPRRVRRPKVPKVPIEHIVAVDLCVEQILAQKCYLWNGHPKPQAVVFRKAWEKLKEDLNGLTKEEEDGGD
jgi:hypothetical protein